MKLAGDGAGSLVETMARGDGTVDELHSNVASAWGRLRARDQAWPTDEQWVQLRAADGDGRVSTTFTLPMLGISLLELRVAG